VALGLIGLSTPVLWAAMILAGLALRLLKPGIGFEAPPPLWPALGLALVSYLTSWLIIAIHTWIGVRWPNFVVAMSVEVAATVIAVIVLQSKYNLYYPWTLPAVVTGEAIGSGRLLYAWIAAGSLGGVLVALLGGLEFTRRDVL
jgi:lantibiotic transport system permease protein